MSLAFLLLLIGGELLLPLQLQFPFDLVQLLLQPFGFGEQSITASPFGINRCVQRPTTQLLLIAINTNVSKAAPLKCGQWLTFGQLCSCLGLKLNGIGILPESRNSTL